MKKILTGLVLVACSTTASATLYNITSILDGNDGGFGFSGFHYAGNSGETERDTDGSPMTGSGLASFDTTTAVGTYNDDDGAFTLTADLVGAAGSVTLTGTLDFLAGLLNPAGTIFADFTSPAGFLQDGNLDFSVGQVCCSGTNPPNSFDGALMSLWGYGLPDSPLDPDAYLGLDLRIELTAVPVPAAAWLFGSGLLGLVGAARRKSA